MSKDRVRYTLDLSPDVDDIFCGIAYRNGLTKGQVLGGAIVLLHAATKAVRNGDHVGIGKSKDDLKTEFVLA